MTRVVLFVIATVAWAILAFLTSFVTRLSSWVVYNDQVWAKMDADGLKREHMFCETVHATKEFPFTVAVAVVGLIFLGLLFQTFFRSHSQQSAL